MKRLLHALAVGGVAAGILHILALILLPDITARQRWQVVENRLVPMRMTGEDLPFFSPDPFFRNAACRFDLRGGPVRVRAHGAVAGWLLSIYAPGGQVLAGFGDRTAPEPALDILLAASTHGAQVAPGGPSITELDTDEGLAVLQVFVPDKSWSAATEAFLATAACEPSASVQ